ncbi:unnamed protein product [Chrysoparadoxa australica]
MKVQVLAVMSLLAHSCQAFSPSLPLSRGARGARKGLADQLDTLQTKALSSRPPISLGAGPEAAPQQWPSLSQLDLQLPSWLDLKSVGSSLGANLGEAQLPLPEGLESFFSPEQLQSLSSSVDKSLLGSLFSLMKSSAEGLMSAANNADLSNFDAALFMQEHVLPVMAEIESQLQMYGLTPEQSQVGSLAVAAAGGAFAFLTLGYAAESVLGDEEDSSLPTTYDLEKIESYYNARPARLLTRLASTSFQAARFVFTIWVDSLTGRWEEKMPERADTLRQIVQNTGPAFIKVAQGVSVRPDILPEPYLVELQRLQDEVAPFSSEEARGILRKSLGKPLSEVFEDTSAFQQPVAAASLGQVYRAKLKDGTPVAVKVQRPGVLGSVTLDLYVIRLMLLGLSKNPSTAESSLSVLGVIDNWAIRFLDELNYNQEAANGDRFRKEMGASKTLGEAIVVPKTYLEYTSRYILVSEWIEGRRVSDLDTSTPEGKQRMEKIVATLLNAYLTQLLDSGFLHADPHPGNFICTTDNKLCVLDYGLMTEVTEDQRYALLEYVSHLTAKDYEATLYDLITLGFIPEEIGADPEKAGIVAPLLATVLEQLSNGGGAKSVTVETVGEEVEALGKQYPIKIPSYFGLIVRAFGAIEGLGLTVDSQYSIVNQCFPYLARRLLTDDSPRMRNMLKVFLYGKDSITLNVDRVDELLSGYSTFTSLAAEASEGIAGMTDSAPQQRAVPMGGAASTGFATRQQVFTPSPVVAVAEPSSPQDRLLSDPVARDALKLLFAKEGNYVQDLVIEELVRMTDALSREANLAVLRVLQNSLSSPLSPLTFLSTMPLTPLSTPFKVQQQVFGRLETVLSLSSDDEETLRTLRRLFDIVRPMVTQQGDEQARGRPLGAFPLPPPFRPLPPQEVAQLARDVASLLSLIGPGARAMIQRFQVQLTTRQLARLADSLEDQGSRR